MPISTMLKALSSRPRSFASTRTCADDLAGRQVAGRCPSCRSGRSAQCIAQPTCDEMQKVCAGVSGMKTDSIRAPSASSSRYFVVPSADTSLRAMRRRRDRPPTRPARRAARRDRSVIAVEVGDAALVDPAVDLPGVEARRAQSPRARCSSSAGSRLGEVERRWRVGQSMADESWRVHDCVSKRIQRFTTKLIHTTRRPGARDMILCFGRQSALRPCALLHRDFAMIVRDVLDNGLRLVTEAMPHVRSCQIGVWLTRGSRHESDERSGIAHFVEHMLFKGTTSRSAEDIAQEIDSIGGQLDAFTSKEYAGYYIKVLDEHLPLGASTSSPTSSCTRAFADDDIEREKKVILEEIKMVEDTPDDLVHEIFTEHLLGGPSARPADSRHRRRPSRRSTEKPLRQYFRDAYIAPNLIVSAAGNLDHDAAARL